MRILITSYYTEQNILRKRELDHCLAANLMNRYIDKIVLVCDESVPDTVNFDMDKIIMHRLGKRPTFADMFYRVAPKYATEDDIVVVANSDIYFDDSLRSVDFIQWDKDIALCLSRWDKKENGWEVYPSWDSQDCWIFKGEIKSCYAEFPMGKAGCDNRIMYELDNAGYWVFNPSKDIKCYHVHDSGVRTYDAEKRTDSVPPPYKLMQPHDLSTIKMRTPKKILHIGLYSFFAERAIGYSLADIGEYTFIRWEDYCENWKIIPAKKDLFEKAVLDNVRGKDVVFCQLQTPDIITKDLARKMRVANPNAKFFNWTGDVRDEVPKDFIEIAPYFTSLFTNETDVKKMNDMGFDAKFLDIGFPQDIYNPKGISLPEHEIVFMGNNYYDNKEGKHIFPNGKARQDMVMFLKETYGDRFGVYGSGWGGLESGIWNHDAIREAAIYRGAKIAINYSHYNYDRYSSDRILRIMGCGTFCITHNYPLVEKDYKIGEHLAVFDSFSQLKNEIDIFLKDDAMREKIAKQGCDFVHKNCTWDKRLKSLLK